MNPEKHTMKAAVLYRTGEPLVVESGIEVPPPGPGQVLVKLAYSGLCHSQLMEVRGRRGEDRYLPHLLGHEGSGLVLATGGGVTKVKAGDKVILGWIKGRGLDPGGTTYSKDGRVINSGGVTTFNELTIVAENRCVVIPPGVPSDIAVLFGCAIPTGAGMVINTVKPGPGSTIAFFGLGGVGLSALMAAGLYDCKAVIAVDLERSKLELAAGFGATHTIDSSACDPVAEIRNITDGKGVDFAVEAAGVVDTIQQAFDSIRFGGGLCVFATHPRHGDRISIDPFDLIRGKRIAGSWGGDSNPDEDVPKIAGLYTQGKLPLEKLVEQRYPLEEINRALDDLENRRTVRALIEIDPDLF